MYFDHVRCPSCGAQFDPESIDTSGGVAACPACGAQLDIKSLFGVAAHLEEVDAPNAHIDDLVSGYGDRGEQWRTTSAHDPFQDRQARRTQQGRGPSKPAHSTSMVRRVKGDEDDGEGEASGPSAVLKALRDLKRK